jgi:hypothetical protein
MYYVVAASNDVVFIPLARTVVARFQQRLAIDDLTDSLLFVPGMIDNELSDLDTLSFSLFAVTEAVQNLIAENRDETLSCIRGGIGLDECCHDFHEKHKTKGEETEKIHGNSRCSATGNANSCCLSAKLLNWFV